MFPPPPFLPPPLPRSSPTLPLLWAALHLGLLPLSFLAQRSGRTARVARLLLGGALMGVIWRLMGGVDREGDDSKILLNLPLGLILFTLALTIPRLALPSTPYVHSQPHLVPSTTLDLLINVTLLHWNPTSYYPSPHRQRKDYQRSWYEHLFAGLRMMRYLAVLSAVLVVLWPIWEGYERGERELFVELAVGAAAGLVAYLIVEGGFHLVAALFIGALGWNTKTFPELMDKPWMATSVHDFWSNRWHPLLTPCFLFLSRPLPQLLKPLFIFLLSGIFHEWGLFTTLPYLPSPFANPNRDFRYTHTFTGFFALQAIPFALETVYRRVTGKRVGGWIGWIWCWGWLFGGGRWVVRGLRDSGVVGYGALILQQWWASSRRNQTSTNEMDGRLGLETWTRSATSYLRSG